MFSFFKYQIQFQVLNEELRTETESEKQFQICFQNKPLEI